ncbi:putative DsbA family dithiol-disulfide isomerase [Chitinophaga dinghuensis]|uniref:Putative DsbA family dithiol-disulfide isomerase n=1 Tax=Chitinophaga dinghuensis TaxID=1539050 RepID=A0A327VK58_9BACT|nr:DsbA family protein [Chitinophaga dinghuensis]RAJ73697.1 putative DsbA family dithiol-disulfide isomerase [Chitinophaga dinghuensis]
METKNNPLLCDPNTGICEMPATRGDIQKQDIIASEKPVKIIYFTDPICSSCWGIEPQLRKLKLEYGSNFEIIYHMGGLLPDWSYNSGGISKPSDVAHHWDEVSEYYQMPIDGDVWLEDPLHSSYPPSTAFKAAQLQDTHKAVVFLRIMREMVFLQKKNITKWEHVSQAAMKAGLDLQQLKDDYEGNAILFFREDLNYARNMGIRGFPTLFIADNQGNMETVYGTRPYATYEQALLIIHPSAIKTTYSKDWKSLFSTYPSLTRREFAELADLSLETAEKTLNQLVENQELKRLDTKNGALWTRE